MSPARLAIAALVTLFVVASAVAAEKSADAPVAAKIVSPGDATPPASKSARPTNRYAISQVEQINDLVPFDAETYADSLFN